MNSRDYDVLEHIRTYCQEIRETVERYGDSFEVFSQDKDYKKSVVFSILQIGELTTHLSSEFQDQHSEIPWHEIRATRNIAAHRYGKLDEKSIFESIHQDIPELEEFVDRLMTVQELLDDVDVDVQQQGDGPELTM